MLKRYEFITNNLPIIKVFVLLSSLLFYRKHLQEFMNNTVNTSTQNHPLDHDAGKKLCSLCGLCMASAWPAEESHLIKNYYFVKYNYPELLPRLVPNHTYSILNTYDLEH